MLGDDDLGDIPLVFRNVVVVEALPVNKEHKVRVLLETVMKNDMPAYKIVLVINCEIEHIGLAVRYYGNDLVPTDIALGKPCELFRRSENCQAPSQASPHVAIDMRTTSQR